MSKASGSRGDDSARGYQYNDPDITDEMRTLIDAAQQLDLALTEDGPYEWQVVRMRDALAPFLRPIQKKLKGMHRESPPRT